MSPLAATTILGAMAIAVLVGLSALFSSSETAIFTLPADWLADEAAGTGASGATLQRLREDPHRLLVTVLVGNNVVNVAIASITTVLVTEHLPAGIGVTVATVVASFLILIFGEIVPKSYGLGHAKGWALTVARPIAAIGVVLYPLVAVFDAVTRRLSAWLGADAAIETPYVEE